DVEPHSLGQPANDQGDVRPSDGLPLPVHGAGRGRHRSVRFAPLLAAGLALAFVATAGAARIAGTRQADLLLGTSRPDSVSAAAGNDRIDVAAGGRDRVKCGKGFDLVAADSLDRVGLDCEVVSRRISRDPYRGTDAQHASEAEPDSFSWGSTVVAAFQVARFATGGAMNIGYAVSTSAGRTWRSGFLPGLTTAS